MRTVAVLLTLLGTFGCTLWSRARHLAPPSAAERQAAATLRRHVEAIASEPHNVGYYAALRRAAGYIESQLERAGYHSERQSFSVGGRDVANLEAERPGRLRPEQIVIIGAHYDSVGDVPGANDNGSGVAVLLGWRVSTQPALPGRTPSGSSRSSTRSRHSS